jgi:pyruvate dehydrogenase E1 component alpha subunit
LSLTPLPLCPPELKQLEKSLKKEVDAAVEEAKAAPIPPEEWAFRNVYVDNSNVVLRGATGEPIKPVFDTSYKM